MCTEATPEATPTSVNEARSKADISVVRTDATGQTIVTPASLHSARREYIEHGLELSHMSIDDVVEDPKDYITNICHIFQECNFEGGEEDVTVDAPSQHSLLLLTMMSGNELEHRQTFRAPRSCSQEILSSDR